MDDTINVRSDSQKRELGELGKPRGNLGIGSNRNKKTTEENSVRKKIGEKQKL